MVMHTLYVNYLQWKYILTESISFINKGKKRVLPMARQIILQSVCLTVEMKHHRV